MAATRMNPKTLQYIMGHSDISVTLNVCTHLGFDDASEEIGTELRLPYSENIGDGIFELN